MEAKPLFRCASFRHNLVVAAFSNSFDQIISAGKDGSIVTISFVPRFKTERLSLTEGSVTCIAVDRQSRAALVGSSLGEIFLISPDHNAVLKTFKRNDAPINSISISPDSSTFVSASNDGSIKFYRFPSCDLIGSVCTRHTWVKLASFSQDGGYLATSGNDRRVSLWNLRSDTPTRMSIGPLSSIPVHIGFDGERLIVGIMNGGTEIFSVENGRKLRSNNDLFLASSGSLSVAISEEGKLLLRKSSALKPSSTIDIKLDSSSSACICNDGKHFLTYDTDGSIIIWEIQKMIYGDLEESENLDQGEVEEEEIFDLPFSEEEDAKGGCLAVRATGTLPPSDFFIKSFGRMSSQLELLAETASLMMERLDALQQTIDSLSKPNS